jgi:putative membrane protein
MSGLFDPGLQPERTGLAWRRTALALLIGSLAAGHTLAALFGGWAALPGLAGAAIAGLVLLAAHRRYRSSHLKLAAEGDRSPIAGGRMIAAMTLIGLVAAVVAGAVVIALSA